MSENESFTLQNYFTKMDRIICNILSRPKKQKLTYDLLDSENRSDNRAGIILNEKQRQMKIGEIWQEAIGNWEGFMNLKSGHYSGLDVLSEKKKIIIEIKNRTNTDNASSRKTKFDQLAKFKREHPDYTCIYACINANTNKKTLDGKKKMIQHDDVEIEYQVGYTFLNVVFGEHTQNVVNFIREKITEQVRF